MTRIFLFLLTLLGLGCVGFFITYQSKLNYQFSKNIEVTVGQGQGFNNVINLLNKQDSDISIFFTKFYLKLNNLSSQLKFGEYRFPAGTSLKQALYDLSAGNIIKYKVTIPEGYNMYEIADLLVKNEIIKNKSEFITLAQNKKMVKNLIGIDAPSLEGYLYPTTYELSKNSTSYNLLTHFVTTFKKEFSSLLSKYKLPENLNEHEVVILASMVEKETGAPEERPRIASVFFNRLQKKMRLQSDPTTIYGKWVETGERLFNIQKKHLLERTDYNTYAIPALPLGPIANPGLDALKSILNPETSTYLYFVSKNDGTHYFSKSYSEHNKAVKRFQLQRRRR